MLYNVAIWVQGISYDQVVSLGHQLGEPVPIWDDHVWRCWKELGWDQRPDCDLEDQPVEIRAYYVRGAILEQLGLSPLRPGVFVLFICDELEWAAIASTVALEAAQA